MKSTRFPGKHTFGARTRASLIPFMRDASVFIILTASLNVASLCSVVDGFASGVSMNQIRILGPTGSEEFGKIVTVLPNNNIVVVDSKFDVSSSLLDVGAIYLFDGRTRLVISIMTGSSPSDQIGNDGIEVLTNGNFVVRSSLWNNGSLTDAGAVTLCNAYTGCPGAILMSNSLVGGSSYDRVGSGGLTGLTNGDFVVISPSWNNIALGKTDAGAATWCNGLIGKTGLIAASNSLVGQNENDLIGSGGVKELANGSFVVLSPSWNYSSTVLDAGAATWAKADGQTVGLVSESNSIVGQKSKDRVGSGGVVALSNSNFVVSSPSFSTSLHNNVGAVTWANGQTGPNTPGPNPPRWVFGQWSNDSLGSGGIVPLANGNYVILSPQWDANGQDFGTDRGNVMFSRGTDGLVMSSTTGSFGYDRIGSGGVTKLANGDFVVSSPQWGGASGMSMRGAATYCSATRGCSSSITTNESLIGDRPGDMISSGGVVALPNGNYVVSSPNFDSATNVGNAGSAVFCIGKCKGSVNANRALVGSRTGDMVGLGGVTVLSSGDFAVISEVWNDPNGPISGVGAVTICNQSSGCPQAIDASNSLIGRKHNDNVGNGGVYPLSDGSYVVSSPNWDSDAKLDVGAVTYCSANNRCAGLTDSTNSLIGINTNDRVGTEIEMFPNSYYAIKSPTVDNNFIVDAGAVTLGRASIGTVGLLSAENSLRGSAPGAGATLSMSYYATGRTIVTGFPRENAVVVAGALNSATPFDFDGDGRSDISIFRPSENKWYILRSRDSTTYESIFAIAGDVPTPADFDGDGKTDVAVFRALTGDWWYLSSSDNTQRNVRFGMNGDIPVASDFDGDGKADFVVYRSTNNVWYGLGSMGAIFIKQFGAPGDKPLKGDFDGDGKTDIAVFRSATGEWWYSNSGEGGLVRAVRWGQMDDVPSPEDFDGDGKTDFAVYRPSNGTWYVSKSSNRSISIRKFGLPNDRPVAADYDGDGRVDVAVFRPSSGVWYLDQSTNGFGAVQWGVATDMPAAGAFIR